MTLKLRVFFIVFGASLSIAVMTYAVLGRAAPEGGWNFRAQTNTGAVMRLSQLPGDMRLVYFGYMNCPDVCLTASLTITSAFKNLQELNPEARSRILNVFVTLDPEDDTIDGEYNELQGYLDARYGGQGAAFRPRDEADARRIASRFAVHFEYVDDPFFPNGYRVDHHSMIYLTDKYGKIIAFYPDRMPGRLIAN